MAAIAKPRNQAILDALVDFGPEDPHGPVPLSPAETEAQRRIRNIVKEMEELNRRIDNLLNQR